MAEDRKTDPTWPKTDPMWPLSCPPHQNPVGLYVQIRLP